MVIKMYHQKNLSFSVLLLVDDIYLLRMFNGSDDASSQQELFPGATQVDDVNTISTALEHVLFHLVVYIFRPKMSGGGQQLSDIKILEG